MAASAFDLLRSAQRWSRQPVPFDASVGAAGTSASVGGGGGRARGSAEAGNLFGEAEDHLRLPFAASSVAIDEASGLWWAVEGHRVLFFPLLGQQWPPLGVHHLPSDAALSPNCVGLLSGPGHLSHGSVRDRTGGSATAPCAVAVLSDLRLAVFPEGQRVDLPRPIGAPMGQVPQFLVIAWPHPSPGVIGVVLVIGTTSGRLFSVLLEDHGSSYSATAGPLWQTCGQGGLNRWFTRFRRAAGGTEPRAEGCADTCPPVQHVEILPAPPGTDALFSVLAWGGDKIVMYVHPHDDKGAELAWVLPLAHLVGNPQASLLKVHVCREGQGELLLLYELPNTQKTVLARSAWPSLSIREPPQPVRGSDAQVVVGPSPWRPGPGQTSGAGTLFSTLGNVLVSAVPNGERRCVLATIYLTGSGLKVEDAPPIDMPILGLALLPLSTSQSSPQRHIIAVLTPHGLLDCPLAIASEGDPSMSLDPQNADISSAINRAFEIFSNGQEEKAKGLVQHICAAAEPGLEARLGEAIEERTNAIIGAPVDTASARWRGVGEEVISRYLLFDKARDMQKWLCFLSEAGVWNRLGGSARDVAVRQVTAEACERLFVATRLRELDDRNPQVFAGAIHRAVQEQSSLASSGDSALADACSFYSNVGMCDRLLTGLLSYARSLPLGSADVAQAMIFVNDVVVTFLESALDQREQLLKLFPALLPPPPVGVGVSLRYLEGSAQQPRGVGSNWLLSPFMLRSLEDLRLLNLKVMPPPEVRGFALLDAQALRVAESFHALCRSTLRAAHASYCTLHGPEFTQLRRDVLRHLSEAEATLSPPASADGIQPSKAQCCWRSLRLAEEFEDIDTVVALMASSDPARLDALLAKSGNFRLYALAFFLRTPKLQPLFFRAIRKFPPSDSQLEELLERYPELRWTLDLQGLQQSSSGSDWHVALEQVSRRTASSVQKEAHSAARRDMFAALAVLARAADAGATDTGRPRVEGLDPVVADISCLGRLQNVVRRFEGYVADQSCCSRKRPSEAPASAEEIMKSLAGCVKVALGVLREEGRSLQLLQDAAHLVFLFERGLAERGICFDGELAPKDADSARSTQRLWSQVIMADEASWQQALRTREGAAPLGTSAPVLPRVLSQTGFYKMLACRGVPGAALPSSANVDSLCDVFAELRPLKPVLQEVSRAAVDISGK